MKPDKRMQSSKEYYMENHKFKIGLGTFDFTKGAAIILVILGHMILEYDFLSFSSTSMKTSTLFVRYVLDPMYSSINIGLMPCFSLSQAILSSQ